MKVNCDIGERGHNQTDIELMQLIDIANIACAGHAGDAETVNLFRKLAIENNVRVAAHLSYPDKENFGRISMDISADALKSAFDEQYALLPDIKYIKLHGALYNDCWINKVLAETVLEWLLENDITNVLAPGDSFLAEKCLNSGINVLKEAFAERRYSFSSSSKKLTLVSRSHPLASITNCVDAVKQVQDIKAGKVTAFIDNASDKTLCSISADTVCIHSDSAIALELARGLRDV